MGEVAVERIRRIDRLIDSVVTPLFHRVSSDRIRADIAAGLPFAGVPILLNDVGQELAGERYGAGVAALHDAGFRSTETTPFAASLEALGLSSSARQRARS
ncbi:MAG: hypothetical protein WBM50_09725 [Acidimicrobiales bacterium]